MIYDIDDIKGEEPKGFELWFHRFLLDVFGETAAKIIYGLIIRTIVFFKKIGLFLSLPFKFVQFFIQSLTRSKSED